MDTLWIAAWVILGWSLAGFTFCLGYFVGRRFERMSTEYPHIYEHTYNT